ncbi:NAD(P)H-hydrate dehydratase [uncultured Roseovarius sp.]|uniref:NAD(P)H-hydrate dehydratase n=1 Tax=uncultured Roseovarius sp. TaxID=293344 RepID=UPI0026374439|nr:NAD(P)H-hydrate dehydratase [uncultured Roseovarius sp.]
MTELLTAAQMRAIEQAAIESGEVTGLELMERAGRGVVEAIFEEWPELAKTSHRAVVLCGPGNNGGDGFVVARLLKEWGWEVEVFLYGDPKKLPPDAKVNYERWGELGLVSAWQKQTVADLEADLFVDAVFGAGLTRALPAEVGEAHSEFYAKGASFGRLVSIDAPSGLCMDSGRYLGRYHGAVYSWLNVSFHRAGVGQYLDRGPAHCTKNVVKDIGLAEVGPETPVVLNSERYAEFRGIWELFKSDHEHKYSHGHALILSGGSGKTGAARLAARGALRIGAGLVTIGVPPSAQMEVAAQVTAVMLRRVEDGDGLAAVLEDARFNALCLGPGLGGEWAQALVPVALTEGGMKPHPTVRRSVVLDADALTAFEDAPETLFEMLHENCVLTPHAGEFARLFPDIAEKLNAPTTKGPAYSKVDATREAAQRAGCVVLFKGPDTVIAAPDGRCCINSAQYERAAPWLATAGSGDVLAGFITGLLARGFDPMQATEMAAWLHVECARSFGPGLIAEDLPEELPKVFRSLGL